MRTAGSPSAGDSGGGGGGGDGDGETAASIVRDAMMSSRRKTGKDLRFVGDNISAPATMSARPALVRERLVVL